MRIAVAGGTGVVGRYVVEAAHQAGHDVVVMSRRSGVDVRTGDGLPEALKDVDVAIDTTNAATTNRAKATAFFTDVAGQLQAVGAAQGVGRLVALSIVGLERVPGFGYYEAKLAHEAALLAGPLPVSIVRATQFHEFPAQVPFSCRRGPLGIRAGHEDSAGRRPRRGRSPLGDRDRAHRDDDRDRRARTEEPGRVGPCHHPEATPPRGGGSAPGPGPGRKGHAHGRSTPIAVGAPHRPDI